MAATLELILKGTDQVSGTFSSIEKKSQGLAGGLKKSWAIAGAGAAAGLGLATAAAVKFVGAAGDLTEAQNKADVVFGASAKKINDFAASSAKSFGIAKVDALSYSSTLGTILKGSGLAEDATADMSVGLTKLAADMASFNNIPVDQALEKIRAGLVGESEPLRTVGVLLSEAAVKEKAYQLGLAATGAELTDAQKVQARYALILDQTKDTQGDFARTSGSLANQQRILGAEWKNIQAILGNALLPVITRVAQALTKFLTENEANIQRFVDQFSLFVQSDVLPTIGRAFEQLEQLIQGIIATGILQWLEDHKVALAALGVALLALVVAFAGPVIVIPALIAAGMLLLAHWDEIRAKIDEVVGDFQEKFPLLVVVIETVFGLIKNRVEFYINTVRSIIAIVTALIHGDFGAAWQGIKDLLGGFLTLIQGDFERIFPLLKTIAVEAIQAIPDLLRGLAGAFTGAAEELGLAIVRGIAQGINKAAGFVGDMAEGILGAIKNLINTQLIDKVNRALEFKVDLGPVGSVTINPPDIPQLAKGGIVTRPTLALIGEAGPEAVVPLGQARRLPGGGVTVVFNYQPVISLASPDEIHRAGIELKRILRGAL